MFKLESYPGCTWPTFIWLILPASPTNCWHDHTYPLSLTHTSRKWKHTLTMGWDHILPSLLRFISIYSNIHSSIASKAVANLLVVLKVLVLTFCSTSHQSEDWMQRQVTVKKSQWIAFTSPSKYLTPFFLILPKKNVTYKVKILHYTMPIKPLNSFMLCNLPMVHNWWQLHWINVNMETSVSRGRLA